MGAMFHSTSILTQESFYLPVLAWLMALTGIVASFFLLRGDRRARVTIGLLALITTALTTTAIVKWLVGKPGPQFPGVSCFLDVFSLLSVAIIFFPNHHSHPPLDQTLLDNQTSKTKALPAFLSWAGLLVGILSTGFVALISYPIITDPHNVGLGFGLWFPFVSMATIFALIFGLPFAIASIIHGRKLVGWMAVVFTLIPLLLVVVYLAAVLLLHK